MKNKPVLSLAILLAAFMFLTACNIQTTVQNPTPTTPVLVVHVDEAVEYRTGPGVVYDVVGTLTAGQEVEVVGISADGDYWLIKAPVGPEEIYWLPADAVTVIGVTVAMPIATPPPTPTLVGGPLPGSGCPSPVPSGPTPVSCETIVPPAGSGCPSPVPSGPTPVYCGPVIPSGSGCPSPVPSGPTPVSCSGGGGGGGSGCPSPVPSGPTPVSCSPFVP